MQATVSTPQFISVGEADDARQIAYLYRASKTEAPSPTFIWLGGYRSDMTGTKAIELDNLAAELGFACLRLDYSGHGASGGDFNKGTISRWLEESLAVIAKLAPKDVILVGSSMGGWIALRIAQELQKQANAVNVKGILLIAPAPDFTAELIEPNLSEAEKKSLDERGYFEEHSEYSPEPNIFTKALIEDGRNNLVLQGTINTNCSVHILQGMNDPDVPYQHALRLVEHLPADNVVITLIKEGDHRLSRPQDLERMKTAATNLSMY